MKGPRPTSVSCVLSISNYLYGDVYNQFDCYITKWIDFFLLSEKIQRKKNPKRDAESSSLDHSCYVANVTPSSLQEDRLVCTPNLSHKLSL